MKQILYAFSFLAQLFLFCRSIGLYPLITLQSCLSIFVFWAQFPHYLSSISGILSLIQSTGHPVWLPPDSVGFEFFKTSITVFLYAQLSFWVFHPCCWLSLVHLTVDWSLFPVERVLSHPEQGAFQSKEPRHGLQTWKETKQTTSWVFYSHTRDKIESPHIPGWTEDSEELQACPVGQDTSLYQGYMNDLSGEATLQKELLAPFPCVFFLFLCTSQ